MNKSRYTLEIMQYIEETNLIILSIEPGDEDPVGYVELREGYYDLSGRTVVTHDLNLRRMPEFFNEIHTEISVIASLLRSAKSNTLTDAFSSELRTWESIPLLIVDLD